MIKEKLAEENEMCSNKRKVACLAFSDRSSEQKWQCRNWITFFAPKFILLSFSDNVTHLDNNAKRSVWFELFGCMSILLGSRTRERKHHDDIDLIKFEYAPLLSSPFRMWARAQTSAGDLCLCAIDCHFIQPRQVLRCTMKSFIWLPAAAYVHTPSEWNGWKKPVCAWKS